MAGDVSQWLEEIKSLQQQLAELQQELQKAHGSTDRWRELYNKEAQQRRSEVQQHQAAIAQLRSQLEDMQGKSAGDASSGSTASQLASELSQLDDEGLKAKLIEVLRDRDRARQEVSRLSDALEAEKVAHEQTRASLTSALGDTVELLKKGQSSGKGGPNLDLFQSLKGIHPPTSPEKQSNHEESGGN